MWQIFYFEIFHFILNIFAGFTFFLIFYLYFDAWLIKKERKEIFKILGYLFLSISFLIHSLYFETTIINQSLFFNFFNNHLYPLFKILGYIFLLTGLYLEPLPKLPFEKTFNFILFFSFPWQFFSPIFSSIIALLYWRRMSLGLERHLKKLSIGFYILSLSELFSLSSLFEKTNNPVIFNLVSPFKLFWFISHFLLLSAVLIMFFWVWYYLFKRLFTQLFIIFQSFFVLSFIIITFILTSLLLKNIEQDKRNQLKINIKVLNFAIESKKQSLSSQIKSLAKEEELINSLSKKDKKNLSLLSTKYLLDYQKTSVLILSENAQVLARGENNEQIGESLSENLLIKKALKEKQTVVGLINKEEIISSSIFIQSVEPVFKDENLIGFLIIEEKLDNNFIDGLKKSTGLEASIYGKNRLSATNIDFFGKNISLIGIEEKNKIVMEKVFKQKQTTSLSINILNIPYLGAFSPIYDLNNKVIGMFFIGEPETKVFQTAVYSMQITFLTSIILLIFSILPIFYLSKYLNSQLK